MVSNKSKKKSQESIKDEKSLSKEVLTKRAHSLSTSSYVQATIVEAENPSAHIKFLTDPNQPQNFKFSVSGHLEIKISKGLSSHHGLISSSGCIMMLILTQHFALPVKMRKANFISSCTPLPTGNVG